MYFTFRPSSSQPLTNFLENSIKFSSLPIISILFCLVNIYFLDKYKNSRVKTSTTLFTQFWLEWNTILLSHHFIKIIRRYNSNIFQPLKGHLHGAYLTPSEKFNKNDSLDVKFKVLCSVYQSSSIATAV
jgi:hypothetical protein